MENPLKDVKNYWFYLVTLTNLGYTVYPYPRLISKGENQVKSSRSR